MTQSGFHLGPRGSGVQIFLISRLLFAKERLRVFAWRGGFFQVTPYFSALLLGTGRWGST